MNEKLEIEAKVIDLIGRLEESLPVLKFQKLSEPARFADVILLDPGMPNPDEGKFIQGRPVETSSAAAFSWIFTEFVKIASLLPDYRFLKEELFGRLGNTILKTEQESLALSTEEKFSYVIQDFWEICQDILEGKFKALEVAVGSSIYDDYITRALNTPVISGIQLADELSDESNQ